MSYWLKVLWCIRSTGMKSGSWWQSMWALKLPSHLFNITTYSKNLPKALFRNKNCGLSFSSSMFNNPRIVINRYFWTRQRSLDPAHLTKYHFLKLSMTVFYYKRYCCCFVREDKLGTPPPLKSENQPRRKAISGEACCSGLGSYLIGILTVLYSIWTQIYYWSVVRT